MRREGAGQLSGRELFYSRSSSPRRPAPLWSEGPSQTLTGYILLDMTSAGDQSVSALRTNKLTTLSEASSPLTIATSASRASWMKWLRTLRSQMGLRGVRRPGRVHSSSINSKTSSPAHTHTQREASLTEDTRSAQSQLN